MVPNARERRRAMATVTGARPLRIAETVFRDTPMCDAKAVAVMPSGARYISFCMSPGLEGCRVLFIFVLQSVIVEIVNDVCVAVLEVECHTPVAGNGDVQSPVLVSLQFVQSASRKIHVPGFSCRFKKVEHEFQTRCRDRLYAPNAFRLEEDSSPLWEKDCIMSKCNLLGYDLQAYIALWTRG